MNIKRKANGGFSNVKDEFLMAKANTVVQAMTGNVFFPTPSPDLTILDSALVDFQKCMALARRKGSPADTAAKNNSRKTLMNVLQQLAFYVSQESNGDLHQLLSSGFDVSNYPKAGDVPDRVYGLLLKDGKQSGQMRLDFTPQQKVFFYEYRFTMTYVEDSDMDWSSIYNTTSSKNNIIAPLIPFEKYYVQVRSVNGYGKSEWSDVVTHVVR